MNWASMFVFFVFMTTMFSVSGQSSPNPIIKSANSGNGSFAMADYYLNNTAVPSYNVNNLISYQAIISYIMDNYKKVYISDVLSIAEHTVAICEKYNMDPLFITALVSVESEFNKYALSSSGAKGLGQLMPVNLYGYKVSDPYDIHQNLQATVRMVKELMDTWKGDTSYSLASYFEGINAVKRKNGAPFSDKTTGYVSRVMNRYNSLKQYL